MDNVAIERLLTQDYSAGTEGFREELLLRCLVELAQSEDGIELTDDSLDLLAAAGEVNSVDCLME